MRTGAGRVDPIVLDALPGPSDEPKANGLVGQVIRQLDMRGLYRTFSGDPTTAAADPRLDVRGHDTGLPRRSQDNPMHALMLPQPRLVRLLEQRARELGVDVRWGHELTDLSPGADGVTCA